VGVLLQREVRSYLEGLPSDWFRSTRLKEEDSFYQKLEMGRARNVEKLEDFFGAMIAVPLRRDVSEAERLVSKFFEEDYRRPERPDRASHRASEFPFSDLRLYGRLRSDPALPRGPIHDMVFEIQIRTFFQHAWSTATHDLVYKSATFSWARSRVSYQVRAMVEQAEMTLEALDALTGFAGLLPDGSPEADQRALLDVVCSHWAPGELPANLRRMTEAVQLVCREIKLDRAELAGLLDRGARDLAGHPAGWTPNQCIIDYASRYQHAKLRRAVTDTRRNAPVLHVTVEVMDRLGLDARRCPRVRL